jgi:hypothetical protein
VLTPLNILGLTISGVLRTASNITNQPIAKSSRLIFIRLGVTTTPSTILSGPDGMCLSSLVRDDLKCASNNSRTHLGWALRIPGGGF